MFSAFELRYLFRYYRMATAACCFSVFIFEVVLCTLFGTALAAEDFDALV